MVVETLDPHRNSTHGLVENLEGAAELWVHGVIVAVEAGFTYIQVQSANVPIVGMVWILVEMCEIRRT